LLRYAPECGPIIPRRWNADTEKQLKVQKNFSELIREADKHGSEVLDRGFLFKKYIDEGLTAEEVKFLHDTCDLINNSIDKEFEKQKLGSLDQELINQMELKVVEEILNHFAQLRV
jgi:hypothetical protein